MVILGHCNLAPKCAGFINGIFVQICGSTIDDRNTSSRAIKLIKSETLEPMEPTVSEARWHFSGPETG